MSDQTPTDPFEHFHMPSCNSRFLSIAGDSQRCSCGLDGFLRAEREQHQQEIERLEQEHKERRQYYGQERLGLMQAIEYRESVVAQRDETIRLLQTQIEMWREAYEGTTHAQEQVEWQSEREAMCADKEADEARIATLTQALERIERHTDCACEHDDEHCCANTPEADYNCPGCLAHAALAAEPQGRETPDPQKGAAR